MNVPVFFPVALNYSLQFHPNIYLVAYLFTSII